MQYWKKLKKNVIKLKGKKQGRTWNTKKRMKKKTRNQVRNNAIKQ